MFLKHIKLYPKLDPFHLLFTLPGILFPQISAWLSLSHQLHFSSVLSQRDFSKFPLFPKPVVQCSRHFCGLSYSHSSLITEYWFYPYPLEQSSRETGKRHVLVILRHVRIISDYCWLIILAISLPFNLEETLGDRQVIAILKSFIL